MDALLAETKSTRVGIVATRSTIKSEEYVRRITQRQPNMQVFAYACPLLVPLVEEGWLHKKITLSIIQEYFSKLAFAQVSRVILGCTHYPLLKPAIQGEFPQMQLVDSSLETAKAVCALLKEKKLVRDNCKQGNQGKSNCISPMLTHKWTI